MARVSPDLQGNASRALGKRSMLRLVLFTIFAIGLFIALCSFLYTPVLQVYWGTAGRIQPKASKLRTKRLKEGLPYKDTTTDIEDVDRTKVAKKVRPVEEIVISKKLEDDVDEIDDVNDSPAAKPLPPKVFDVELDSKDVHLEDGIDYDENGLIIEKKAVESDLGDYSYEIEEKEKAPGAVPPPPAAATHSLGKKKEDEGKEVEVDLAAENALTKEMALKAATNEDGEVGPVVVTWANYHYRDFVMNWVHHLQATGCKNILIGAMDDLLLKVLLDAGIPAFGMSSGLTIGDFGWGSQTFNKMGREKINLIQTFTRFGIDVIISDVDTVWIQNPVPYMQQYPEADVLTSSDLLEPTETDGGLESWRAAYSAANIGIMLFRPSAAELADEWVRVLDADDNYWDQNAFNDLMQKGGIEEVQEGPDAGRLLTGYDGKLTFGILPVTTFCSGQTYFVQRLPDLFNLTPYVVHATFQFSGTDGKRNRFRERLLWTDEAEYFEFDPGWVSVGDQIPENLMTGITELSSVTDLKGTSPHFDLVNHQLTTMRAMFAAATVLGRGAVLPELWCGFDRYWAPHTGRYGGSQMELPFQCPADHVLDLEAMSDLELSESHYGPHIEWREHTFLENSQAKSLRKDTLTVHTCLTSDGSGDVVPPPEGVECADGKSGPATIVDGEVWLMAKRNEEELKEALGGSSADIYSVIHFENAAAAWGGFSDSSSASKFKKRLDLYSSLWCCVESNPGHVWYDFFWDVGSHTDRHGLKVRKWKPATGP